MESTFIVPVALIIAGTTYAIFARYFAHQERIGRIASRSIHADEPQ